MDPWIVSAVAAIAHSLHKTLSSPYRKSHASCRNHQTPNLKACRVQHPQLATTCRSPEHVQNRSRYRLKVPLLFRFCDYGGATRRCAGGPKQGCGRHWPQGLGISRLLTSAYAGFWCRPPRVRVSGLGPTGYPSGEASDLNDTRFGAWFPRRQKSEMV